MKSVIKKAAKYESKKSLEGPMKFLKGNVSKTKKNSISIKKKQMSNILVTGATGFVGRHLVPTFTYLLSKYLKLSLFTN